ncbi:MAG: reprolysin-like metallopeptidase, partial [Acidobacteriota bacterium]
MRSRFSVLLVVATALALLLAAPTTHAQAGDAMWSDVDDAGLRITAKRTIVPERYRALSLDKTAMSIALSEAPLETRADARGNELILSLPLPEGGFERFRVVESPIMAPELAAKFPEIRTYAGQGIDDPAATVRLDQTPAGFHAMVLSPNGTFYIDPYGQDDTSHYISYLKRDARRQGDHFTCAVESHDAFSIPRKLDGGSKALSGDTLRTYRLAVAATGEYTAFHGGTVAQGQAAIVTAMNRVNGIYERDVAIRMVLIANNDQLVYTNGSTDPYSNGSGSAMLGQNQSNIDSVIGSANYDIGHVFSTGGGGIASLRVPCINGSKARGVTGQASPTGDPFWVDFVAHELGHQWGGNHTFNGNAGSCAGGNRNGSTAYEPGSGTTIQAYAGICGAQNIQPNSDDHFHGLSLDEIIAYSANGSGDNCPTRTATGNDPPTVNAGASYTIPINTPFELCGSATDPQGTSSLTYGWEQFDLGSAGAPNSPSGNAPIFRSFSPTTSPCRTFPQLSDLLNNTQTLGEILPSYGRTMNFRLTVRDNALAGGGVADDSTTVTASTVGNNFRVTAPNTAVTWAGNSSQTVTWNVAGTDLSPISCSAVDITLSTDGGNTYPTTLAAGVSNSGSASVTVPNSATNQARVRVRCAGNIFFDISNANFTISASSGNPPTVGITAPANGSSSEIGQSVSFSGTASDPEDGNLTGNLSWTSSIDGAIGSGGSFSTSALSLGSHTITASVTDSDSLVGSDVISITVTPVGGGNGPQNAAYDSGLGTPACAVAGSSCDSLALLDGRDDNGPEPNAPNTLDGCADGSAGTYHSDESNDRIVVSALDGADMVEGATVRIDATVWAWTTPSEDTLDLYYAADATNPSWTLITSITPSTAGEQTLSAQYTLPAGTLQAVRAQFRYQSTNAACSSGTYNDRDDLVFAVGAAAGCSVDADCDNGLFCDGAETCNAGVCESGTAPNCGDGVSCTVDSCNESTDSCNNAPDYSACDNGQFCDGSETCNPASGCEAGTAPCSGGQTCNESTDICEGGSGCTDCVDWTTTTT